MTLPAGGSGQDIEIYQVYVLISRIGSGLVWSGRVVCGGGYQTLTGRVGSGRVTLIRPNPFYSSTYIPPRWARFDPTHKQPQTKKTEQKKTKNKTGFCFMPSTSEHTVADCSKHPPALIAITALEENKRNVQTLMWIPGGAYIDVQSGTKQRESYESYPVSFGQRSR